jgi:hypothetical protein
MYRRIVFVGLGGSGGKTLRFLKRELRYWLRENNWPDSREIPKGFQFLHIDTPTAADGKETDAEMLPDAEYKGLVGPNTTWPAIVSKLDNSPGFDKEFAGWRVEPTFTLDPTIGAGQYRAVGRTVALAYLGQIKAGISQVFKEVTSDNAISELTELAALARKGGTVTANSLEPIVVVISSLAGGTGAGLLMDVFDVMRTMNTWADQSFGILYTPEVFNSLISEDEPGMDGVQPNSLAAISEILNGYYWHGQDLLPGQDFSRVGLKNSKIYANSGIAGTVKRSGPAFPILVGGTNSANVTLNSPDEVFETVGSALLSWCVDDVVQSKLIAYTMANWVQKASGNAAVNDVLVNVGDTEQGIPAFNGIGCARVSVGTRYLEDYASERLARDAANHITSFQQMSPEAKQIQRELKINDPNKLAIEIAKQRLTMFISECKLNEKGINSNDVLEALTPIEIDGEVLHAENVADNLVREGKASAADFLGDIRSGVSSALIDFDNRMKPLLDVAVSSWIANRPKAVIRVIEKYIAEVGLKVTSELIVQTIDYLTNPITGVCAELMGENEHKACKVEASEAVWSGRAEAVLAGNSGKFTKQSNERVREAIAAAIGAGRYTFEAQKRESAVALLSDFAEHFLKPISRKLTTAYFELSEAFENSTAGWPTWDDGEPSSHLQPPKAEYTIIDPSEFPRVFSDMLERSIGGGEGTPHRQIVRGNVISGDFIRETTDSSDFAARKMATNYAIKVTQNWNPGHLIDVKTTDSKSKIDIEMNFSIEDLRARARLWLIRPNTAFCELLKSDLRSYTANTDQSESNFYVDESEYVDRRRTFISKFQSALAASQPLVLLDNLLLQAINVKVGVRPVFSQLPFSNHPLQSNIEDLIRPHINPAEMSTYFGSEPRSSIQVMSMFEGAQHPFVVQSLFQPISEKWNASKVSTQALARFWTKRKARQLAEFVPAPQEHIMAMTRGWITADCLGLLETNDHDSKLPYKISQPWVLSKEPAAFPFPMLSSPADSEPLDKLCAALEALAIAYVEVGEHNNLQPLSAYISLREFGSTKGGAKSIMVYQEPNPLLLNWLRSGVLSSKFEGQEKSESDIKYGLNSKMNDRLQRVSGPEFSIEERKSAFIEEIDALLETMRGKELQYWNQASLDKNQLNNPPYWPTLMSTTGKPKIITNALESLKQGVSNAKLS